MYFCDLENRAAKEVAPGIRIRTFWQEKMLISMVELDANAVLPMHSHEHEQCGVVVSGGFTLTIAGETRTLKPGDSYIVPGNIEHGATVGEQGARVMEVFAPVREEYKY